ncbi:MAG: hypothetical protein KGJ87_09650 [Planctomycetota bacterium]|nr:hypothetical protein [Planctomycetota bacterium]MDE1888942.1 hypothetical protein [Planctomycetota bacterium]MDE2217407.1 hypothetical protein [Planctomycetota bacterium]
MAIWKRKKKAKESEDDFQKEEITEISATEASSASEQSLNAGIPEIAPEDMSSGVILYGKKVSGFFRKGFWSVISIMVLPPVLVFAFSILVIICMLIFPLLAVVLVSSVPIVFVTLFIFFIALPILFPLLVLFLLITGKGRLSIGSEGNWFSLELFGKSYSIK